MLQAQYPLVVYVDDFAGAAASKEEAVRQFNVVRDTLQRLGLEEARHKASPPSQIMVWLGLLFNTKDMTLSIPPDKLADIHTTLLEWSTRKVAHRQQLQSLLGSLFHVA